MMMNKGAIGVVGKSPFLHIRVVTEMIGDGVTRQADTLRFQ